MRLTAAIALILLAGAAGCANPPATAPRGSAAAESPDPARDESPASPAQTAPPRTPAKATGVPVDLPVYEVRESAFTDFGMSVRTNLAVKWGDSVEWMEVSGVAPGTSAAKQHLSPGDRILAIDGELITKFGRDSMLGALFQRKAGDRAVLLLLSPQQGLPRYVTLTAERPRLPH